MADDAVLNAGALAGLEGSSAIISGGFDPVQPGHISMIKDCKGRFDNVIAIIMSDEWLIDKKGARLMPQRHRACVVEAMGCVPILAGYSGPDDTSVSNQLKAIKDRLDAGTEELTFCNGGDRTSAVCSEGEVCTRLGIETEYNTGGGTKLASSSDYLKEWSDSVMRGDIKYDIAGSESRGWGRFDTINEKGRHKIKILTVEPGESLSLQYHHHRAETWVVISGTAGVRVRLSGDDHVEESMLHESESVFIPALATHQLYNPGKIPLKVLELQLGDYLGEDDIVRLSRIAASQPC